jgi:hypothetical protein
MIAAAGSQLLARGERHGLDLNSFSRGSGARCGLPTPTRSRVAVDRDEV